MDNRNSALAGTQAAQPRLAELPINNLRLVQVVRTYLEATACGFSRKVIRKAEKLDRDVVMKLRSISFGNLLDLGAPQDHGSHVTDFLSILF